MKRDKLRTDRARRLVLIGAAVGAALSLTISLLMDVLYADALQGTWRDAIAKDFNQFFSLSLTRDSFLVYLGFMVILAILALVGAFLGAGFSVFVQRFLSFMGEKD